MLKWIRQRLADATRLDAASPSDSKEQGDDHVRAGRYADAERCYRRVLPNNELYPAALVMLGFVLKEQHRVDEAREVLEKAVRVASDDADSHYLLASVLESAGAPGQQILHLREAIRLRPGFELARRQLVFALFRSEHWTEAKDLCEEGISLSPKSAEWHFYLSNVFSNTDQQLLAIESCKRALALDSAMLVAQQTLSRLFFDTEQFAEAERSYRREIELDPAHFGPHHQLGVVLSRLSRHAEAIEQYKQAIELNPRSGASYSSLGAAYYDFDQATGEVLALAHKNYEKAVEVEPANSDLYFNLGRSHRTWARIDLAMSNFDQAIALDPSNVKARWARAMLCAPAFSPVGVDLPARSGFENELSKFSDWWIKSDTDGASFVGEAQPFFLTYQEESNLAPLKKFGEVCAIGMKRWLERQEPPPSKKPLGARIRLGIVSAEIRSHSVWRALIQGWLSSFDRGCFELVIFSLSDRVDKETSWARARSDVFVAGPRSLAQWVASIREQNCEVLIYPSVGLHSIVQQLASLRLAPVQINTWGHPDTAGLPTLDYYVSAECFEPVDAQEHYAERLVLLPHLGNCIQSMTLVSGNADPHLTDIDFERPILLCPGMPFKYQPVDDHVFVEIAQRIPHAQLVFFRPSAGALADVLQNRLEIEFEKVGLNPLRHMRFIRWLDTYEFHFLMRRADVMLDTIGFSGFNTAVQAVECGLPVVTREGRFLRGRLASGVLKRLQMTDLITQTKPAYVDLVVKLVTNQAYRASIRKRIKERGSVLFDDRSAMLAFQEFLQSVARTGT